MKMTLLIEPRRLRLKVNLLLVFICYLVQIDKSNVSSALYLSEQFYLLVYLPLTTSKSVWQVQGLTPINHACFFHDNCFHIFILKFSLLLFIYFTVSSNVNFTAYIRIDLFIVNTENITISKDQYKQQMFVSFCLHYFRRLSSSPQ